jgi:chromosome segregation ATPase
MTARLNSAATPTRRVVSVSAHDADPPVNVDDNTPEAATQDELTRRQSLLNEMIQKGESVVAHARQALSRLQQDNARADQTSLHLQDQLKTGARLLQASQSQASRIESDLRALDDRQETAAKAIKSLHDRLVEFEAGADSMTRRLTSHLAEILNSAMLGFEESVSQRCAVLNLVDQRVAEASQRLESLCAAMDQIIEAINQRLAGATAPMRRELEQRDESESLDVSGAKTRPALGAEALPALRLQSWSGGG